MLPCYEEKDIRPCKYYRTTLGIGHCSCLKISKVLSVYPCLIKYLYVYSTTRTQTAIATEYGNRAVSKCCQGISMLTACARITSLLQ